MDRKPTHEEMEKKVQGLEREVLKRKRVEKTLRESEDRFRLLYESAPLGYQSLDMNGNFIEVNQAWLDALGYTREEVMGKNFGDFLHPDWVDHFKEYFPRFKALGEVLGIEFEMVKKDGSCILIAFNGKIGLNEKGEFRQTHCILHDVTEQRRSYEALRISEEKYRSLFNDALDMIHIVDENGKIIDANPIELETMGYTREEFLGKHLLETIHPDYRAAAKTKSENILKGKRVKAYETVLVTKNSEKIDVEVNVVPQMENGKIISARAILRDISERKRAEAELKRYQDHLEELVAIRTKNLQKTNEELGAEISERKQAEEALRKSEAKYRKFLEMSPDPIGIVQENRHVFINTAFANLFGYTMQDVNNGLDLLQLIPENKHDFVIKLAKERIERKEPLAKYTIIDLVAKGGDIIPCEVSGNLIDFDDRPATLAIIRDITERKQAEAERERLIGELQGALDNIKTLRGLLPICASCKKIRDDKGYWNQIERYIESHSDALFSHGMCPECMDKIYGDEDWYKKLDGDE